MKKLIIKAAALTFISVTTVFAAMANDGSFDQRVEFPELMKMQQEFAEQNASHQLILNSTAEFSRAVEMLGAITDYVELAKQLAYLEQGLAVHRTALDRVRSDAKALFDKTQKEFNDNAKTVEDVKPIEPEIIKRQREKLNEIKKGIITGSGNKLDDATKAIVLSLKKMGHEKAIFANRKIDVGTSTADVDGFLDRLELNYVLIDHHIESTDRLRLQVQRLSMELSTAMVNGSLIEATVFPDQETMMGALEGIESLSIRRGRDINEDELYD